MKMHMYVSPVVNMSRSNAIKSSVPINHLLFSLNPRCGEELIYCYQWPLVDFPKYYTWSRLNVYTYKQI